jgi:hypothetical protein
MDSTENVSIKIFIFSLSKSCWSAFILNVIISNYLRTLINYVSIGLSQ